MRFLLGLELGKLVELGNVLLELAESEVRSLLGPSRRSDAGSRLLETEQELRCFDRGMVLVDLVFGMEVLDAGKGDAILESFSMTTKASALAVGSRSTRNSYQSARGVPKDSPSHCPPS